MRVLKNLWIVVSSTIAAAMLAAWAAIPFLTAEAGFLFFFVGGAVGLGGSIVYLLRAGRRDRPAAAEARLSGPR